MHIAPFCSNLKQDTARLGLGSRLFIYGTLSLWRTRCGWIKRVWSALNSVREKSSTNPFVEWAAVEIITVFKFGSNSAIISIMIYAQQMYWWLISRGPYRAELIWMSQMYPTHSNVSDVSGLVILARRKKYLKQLNNKLLWRFGY